ncbi:MAG: hypothetical protein Q7S22_06170 [Candidatus Micrarchaeota archaeon]|nr:hypothetical protein [Candidatus Micrarchaeota archaeon]
MNKNNLPVIAILLLLTVGLYLGFSNSILSDKTYGTLINDETLSSLGLDNLFPITIILVFLTAVILYFAIAQKENTINSLLVVLLFLFSPLVLTNLAVVYSFYGVLAASLLSIALLVYKKLDAPMKYLALVPVVIALIISLPSFAFSISNITTVGILLPLSILALAHMEKQAIVEKHTIHESIIVLVLGLVFALFSPGISIILLAFAASEGLAVINKSNHQNIFWSAFAFMLILSMALLNPDSTLVSALSLAIGFSILAYFLFFLYTADMEKYKLFFVFSLVILSAISSSLILSSLLEQRASPSLIEAYKFSKTLDGQFGIIDFPNTYAYYSGKNAVILNAENLVSEKPLTVDYAIIDVNGIYKLYGNSSIVFRFDSMSAVNGNPNSALFRNNQQIAVTSLSTDLKSAITDAVIQDNVNGATKRISFLKIRSFTKSLTLSDPRNLLINVENIGSSNLFNLLFRNDKLFDNNMTMIVETH